MSINIDLYKINYNQFINKLMEEPNVKDFIKENIKNIKQTADDLKYCENRELRFKGLEIILYQIDRIEEHMEYLDVKEDNQC